MIYFVRRASRQSALKDEKDLVPYVNSEMFPLIGEVRERLNDGIAALNMTPRIVTASETLSVSDVVILVDAADGDVTLTLPAVSGSAGDMKWIKRVDLSANVVTIAAASSNTIEGTASITLATTWDAAKLSTDMIDMWLQW